MKLIIKGNEPDAWRAHRETSGADYESIFELRESLYADQGGICAYCMRRLPKEVRGTTSVNVVEHIFPRTKCQTAQERMDYANMVLSCDGAIGKPSGSKNVSFENTHCDEHKQDSLISLSPMNSAFIASLSYTSSGKIKSSNSKWDKELNEVLNLNYALLVENRKSAFQGVVSILKKKSRWTKGHINKFIETYSSRDSDGNYKEYCEAVVWKLKKLLERC